MAGFSRRDVLKGASAVAGTAMFGSVLGEFRQVQGELPPPKQRKYEPIRKPITAVICGYGGRGGYYGSMATNPEAQVEIVGVAEPVDYRLELATSRHKIPKENQFVTWEHVFDRPKFADAIIIGTPDNLHYGPAMRALEMGYHLLLEKPIAQNWKECEDILRLAKKKGAIVGVCHVLRYAPYFVQMHALVDQGVIGDLVSIQHMEPIHYLHFAHSYVRGPWHNEKDSNPSLLAKSCHDLDIIKWLMNKPCERVSSFGGLKYFQRDNAPMGAPTHCLDGCPVEDSCIYHAGKVYVQKKLWGTHHIVTRDRSPQSILRELEKGDYGRCVYHNDNDVADHQVVNLQFEGGGICAFNMEAMTSYGGRRTRLMGTLGDVVGDERYLDVYNFEKREMIRWDVQKDFKDLGGHGGGDERMFRDWAQAVGHKDDSFLSVDLAGAMESHLIGFEAERSRKSGGQVRKIAMPKI